MRGPTPPMNGSGSRKPNIARLGIVCTMLASADERRAQPRPARGKDAERHADRDAPARSMHRPAARAGRSAAGELGADATARIAGARTFPQSAPADVRQHGIEQPPDGRIVGLRRSSRGGRRRSARPRRARRPDRPAPTPRSMSCVTMMTVLPTRCLDAAELALQLGARHRVERAERFVHQQHGGSAASARATPTRCRCPPESSSRPALPHSSAARPTRSSSSATRAAIAGRRPRVRAAAPPRCCRRRVMCGNSPTS